MNEKSPVELLNAAEFLFLRELSEPHCNALRIVVEEAVAGPRDGPRKEDPEVVRTIISATRPLVSDSTCYSYELTWRSYISYAVLNESFVSEDKEEKYEGRFLRRYLVSKFLDFVAKGTFADSTYPGPFAHWEVVTLNHIIDIASMDAPHVRRFKNT